MKKNLLFEDILRTVSRYFVVIIIAVVLIICCSGIRFIKSGEQAIILRFGKIVGDTPEEQIHDAGVLFAFPYIIDEVITIPTGSIHEFTVNTHYTEGEMTTYDRNGYVITGDNNIAILSASVKYTISDPVAFALSVKRSAYAFASSGVRKLKKVVFPSSLSLPMGLPSSFSSPITSSISSTI